ncbi:SRPBCC family protein [Henriciella mobilis]|uniref:SRPBCC domain-containing protein n=1 Tax=Henriciella mobilis TaxID=2305467 RepID=A0A399RR23_9PROT|nr:SRPBCC domain-containing protein [Henriciella mobilis]RIJ32449.1 SRPBCC domain-containing protein [Henriciella mobilis]
MKPSVAVSSFVIALAACTAHEPVPTDTALQSGVVETANTGDILEQQIIVEADAGEVWDAFTTSDGYTAWATPFAIIDFRIGGSIESSYQLDAEAGSSDNIKLEILAYLPGKLLVLKTVQAPPGFASQEVLDRLVSVFEFEPVGTDRTRVKISGVGYGDDEESARLRDFFIQGNAYSLRALHDRFVKGPTDWQALFAERQSAE